ncbi:MAG: hypothetical protein QE487_07050 [Fluviicola sp.]|nr:hypothetical protein [Fluviicola sp.]
MLITLTRFLKSNSLFCINILVLLLLLFGLLQTYGTTYLPQIGIYVVAFVGCYFLCRNRFSNWKWSLRENSIDRKWMLRSIDTLMIFTVGFQILHYYVMGNVPVVKAMLSTDYYHITQIRQDIKAVDSSLINYASSFLLKAIIPFLLFLLYSIDKKRFWVYFFVSAFYALALMQKALIVTILIPLIIHLLLNRKWWRATFFVGSFIAGIVLLVLTTNPALRPAPFDCGACENSAPEKDKDDKRVASTKVADGLYHRVFVTTGEIVGDWFHYIPDSIPYGYGNGYRLGAKFSGNEYMDYASLVYKKIRPMEAEMGFDGTATAAYFMYDYANFGNWGLALAGIYLAVFLVFVNRLFKDDFNNLLSLNVLFLLWLSSARFTSTLVSGGWLLVLVLYWFYQPLIAEFKQKQLAKKTA